MGEEPTAWPMEPMLMEERTEEPQRGQQKEGQEGEEEA